MVPIPSDWPAYWPSPSAADLGSRYLRFTLCTTLLSSVVMSSPRGQSEGPAGRNRFSVAALAVSVVAVTAFYVSQVHPSATDRPGLSGSMGQAVLDLLVASSGAGLAVAGLSHARRRNAGGKKMAVAALAISVPLVVRGLLYLAVAS
jgi:hypothetical protein